MNVSKHILSYLRSGDFAHPGEIEAIQLAMNPIAKSHSQHLLDIGCGLGGTAYYLQEHGWGQVVGLDIDAEVISYAKQKYPEISFINGDCLDAPLLLKAIKFNVICFFSSFFCFPAPLEALAGLSKIAAQNCELMIFDYSQLTPETLDTPFYWSKTAKQFNAIYLNEFKKVLAEAGWQFKFSVDISDHFKNWYTKLLQKFENKKTDMINKFDPNLLDAMYKGFAQLLKNIVDRKIGGIMVYATLQNK